MARRPLEHMANQQEYRRTCRGTFCFRFAPARIQKRFCHRDPSRVIDPG